MLRAMSARVALFSPVGLTAARGNAVTVARIARGLAERGVAARVWDVSAEPAARVRDEVRAFRPEVLHAFHARHAGPLAAALAGEVAAPLVVTLTGTDANHDLEDPAAGPVVRAVLRAAALVTVFDARVAAALPEVRPRVATVAQAVRFAAEAPFELASRWALPAERVLFVVPAGIRPVKDPALAARALDAVVARRGHVRLLYAGPILDAAEGHALQALLADRPWARHVGVVPHAAMPALLRLADVVVNCSVSEGGMANAVLEAQALGRAVLARDIAGNRALVQEGITGLLFGDAAGLAAQALRLVDDPPLRARLGAAGRARVERCFAPAREIEGYLAVYRRVAAVPA
jgi:glycosyltransferase involved in cell wall biosynthesis